MDSEVYAREGIRKIIDILRMDPEYGLTEGEVRRRFENAIRADIHTIRPNDETCSIVLHSQDSATSCVFRLPMLQPQMVDPVPMVRDGVLFRYRPFVLIPERSSAENWEWVTVHEICHLLSLGDYVRDADTGNWHHCFGINVFTYSAEWEEIAADTDDVRNEIVNDATTWHFLERMHGKSISPPNVYTDVHAGAIVRSGVLKPLIGCYLGNRVGEVREMLGELSETTQRG